MRKYVSIITVLTLWASVAFAQGESTRTVTVVGSASSQIMPDNILWFLTVTVKDSDQEKLRTRADEVLSRTMAATDRLGIGHNDIVYGKVTIKMHYKHKKRRESDELSHYELSQRITVTQEDVEQYDEYWHELTAIEGVLVSQNFFTSQLETTRRQLRIDALHAARQKADDFAAVVGGSIGKALSISEFKPNPRQSDIDRVSNLTAVMGGGRPEEIKVSAQVYVVFELQ